MCICIYIYIYRSSGQTLFLQKRHEILTFCRSLFKVRACCHNLHFVAPYVATSSVGERGSAPKRGRHPTIFVNPQ